MITDSVQTYYYPNKLGRIILLAMEEIIGHGGVNAILNLSGLHHLINNYPPDNLDLGFPFDDLSRIQGALEHIYGVLGGRGVALRTGRACFKYGLREFGPGPGITDLSFRLLPLHRKLKAAIEFFAQGFNDLSDQQVRLEEDEEHLWWLIDRCALCWQRQTEGPVCHLVVGILQEALYWVSGGRYFEVEETRCLATGDPACTIKIRKDPIDG